MASMNLKNCFLTLLFRLSLFENKASNVRAIFFSVAKHRLKKILTAMVTVWEPI